MKKLLKTTFLFVSVLFLMSCSSDDNNSSSASFTLDGETYKVEQAAIQVFNNLSEGTSNGSISLTGSKGGKIGSVSFSVDYNTTDGIAGTYTSDEGDWDEIEGTYSSWLSSYTIVDGQSMTSSNEPTGPIKIISHGDNQYTLEFNVTYTDNVTASGNVKTTFTVQAMNIN